MKQSEAEPGTVALLGHPGNEILVVKTARGFWRYVDTGKMVDPEQFRAGWQTVPNFESYEQGVADCFAVHPLPPESDVPNVAEMFEVYVTNHLFTSGGHAIGPRIARITGDAHA